MAFVHKAGISQGTSVQIDCVTTVEIAKWALEATNTPVKPSTLTEMIRLFTSFAQTGGADGAVWRWGDLKKAAYRDFSLVNKNGQKETQIKKDFVGMVKAAQENGTANMSQIMQIGLIAKIIESRQKASVRQRGGLARFDLGGMSREMRDWVEGLMAAVMVPRDKAAPMALFKIGSGIERALLIALAVKWQPSGDSNRNRRKTIERQDKSSLVSLTRTAEDKALENMSTKESNSAGNANQILSILSAACDEGGVTGFVATVTFGLIAKAMSGDLKTILFQMRSERKETAERMKETRAIMEGSSEKIMQWSESVLAYMPGRGNAIYNALKQYVGNDMEADGWNDFIAVNSEEEKKERERELLEILMKDVIPRIDNDMEAIPSQIINEVDSQFLVYCALAYLNCSAKRRPVIDEAEFFIPVPAIVGLGTNQLTEASDAIDTRSALYGLFLAAMSGNADSSDDLFAKICHQTAIGWIPTVNYAKFMTTLGVEPGLIEKYEASQAVDFFVGEKKVDAAMINGIKKEFPIYYKPGRSRDRKRNIRNAEGPRTKAQIVHLKAGLYARTASTAGSGHKQHFTLENRLLADRMLNAYNKDQTLGFHVLMPAPILVGTVSFKSLLTQSGTPPLCSFTEYCDKINFSKPSYKTQTYVHEVSGVPLHGLYERIPYDEVTFDEETKENIDQMREAMK